MNYLDNVRRLREIHNMSQSDLAEGICSQGMISKIEKHQVSPDIEIMIKIAKKFNLTVSQLIGQSSVGDTFDTIKREIRLLAEKRDFVRMQSYLDEVHFESLSYSQDFRNWVNAMLMYEVREKPEEALALLLNTLETVEITDVEQHVVILSTLGAIFVDREEYQIAFEYFEQAYELQKDVPINLYMQRRLLFNMARSLYQLQDYVQSVFFTRLAIRSTISEDSLFLLDDLHLLLSDNYKRLMKKDLAGENAHKAEILAQIKGNNDILPYIEKTTAEIETLSIK